MKSKLRTSIFIVVTLLIGFWAGYYRASQTWSEIYEDSDCLKQASQTLHYVRVLTQMRQGQMTNAFDTLEVLLDSSLITFSMYDRLPAADPRSKIILRAIQVAKNYRSDYPQKSGNTQMDVGIKRVFSLAK